MFLISVLGSLLMGVITILCASIMLLGVFTFSRSNPQWLVTLVLDYWTRSLLIVARVYVERRGLEHIPTESCLFVFNHLSTFDIPILLQGIPKKIYFGAKKELTKIPIFGQALMRSGTLIIDRQNRSDAIATLRRARSRFLKGESFILAAEGTRQHEPKIGEFKSGPFILAIEAQVPIVPIVLYGADKIVPKKQLLVNILRKKTVILEILPAVSTKGFSVEDRERIKSEVRQKFVEKFEKLSTTYGR